MRIILKENNKYLTIYWIKRAGNCIVGWYNSQVQQNKNGVDKIHVHFTYPKDGQYHISRELFANNELVRREKIFNNRFAYKMVSQNNPKWISTSLKESPILMPSDKMLKPLIAFTDPNHTFSLPVMGFNMIEGTLFLKQLREQPDSEFAQQEDDIVIDVKNYYGASVNLHCFLFSKENNILMNMIITENTLCVKDTREAPDIYLCATLDPVTS